MSNNSIAKILDKVKFFDKIKILPNVISNSPTYTLQRSVTPTNGGSEITFTVNTTNVSDGTSLPYTITGISQEDVISGDLAGSFTVASNTASTALEVSLEPTSPGVGSAALALNNGAASISVFPAPTYSLSRSASSVNEGSSITFTLTTTGVADGTTVPYTISGISAGDLSSGSLTGNFVVAGGSATVSVTLASDALTDGSETISITAAGQSSSSSVNDTSLTPTYSLSRSSSSVDEGSEITFTLTTTNVADGTTVPYTISGISAGDLSAGSLTGNFVVSNGTATVSVTLASDALTDGSETISITAAGQSSSAAVNDTSLTPTYTLSRSAASVNEGSSVTFTLTTTNVANGASVPYSVSGISADDLSSGSLTGNFIISSGSATVTLALASDALTEGSETITIAAAGQSSSATANDTSLTPTYTLSRSAASVNEGSSITFTLSTTNVANGTLVPYTITGILASDLSSGSLTGNFTINSGSATVTLTAASDLLTEGNETITITAANQTASATINDTSLTPPTDWTQLGQTINGEALYDIFGHSVSMNSTGNRMAVGAIGNDGSGNAAGHVRVYSYNGTSWVQLGQDIDGEAAVDQSGFSVSMNSAGDRVAIGAALNDGTVANSNRGHVRVYSYNGTSWVQLGQDIDGEAASDQSGRSVSLNSAGDRVAIGAQYNDGIGNSAGHVRVYSYNGTSWSQLGQDIDGEAAFDDSGISISMNSTGDRVAIGALLNDGTVANSNRGHVRVYSYNGTSWVKLGQDIDGEAANDYSGFSVSMNSAGDRVVIGATGNDGTVSNSNRGHVRVYSYNGTSWSQLGQDIDGEAAGDQSGYSVSMNSTGDRVAISAIYNSGGMPLYTMGHVRVYYYNGTSWVQLGQDIQSEDSGESFGYSVSVNGAGNRVAISNVSWESPTSGYVKVYSY